MVRIIELSRPRDADTKEGGSEHGEMRTLMKMEELAFRRDLQRPPGFHALDPRLVEARNGSNLESKWRR